MKPIVVDVGLSYLYYWNLTLLGYAVMSYALRTLRFLQSMRQKLLLYIIIIIIIYNKIIYVIIWNVLSNPSVLSKNIPVLSA